MESQLTKAVLKAIMMEGVQNRANCVRDFLLACKLAKREIKKLNEARERLMGRLTKAHLKHGQEEAIGVILTRNRTRQDELEAIISGRGRNRETLFIARVAQEIMNEQPDLGFENWPTRLDEVICLSSESFCSGCSFANQLFELAKKVDSKQKIAIEELRFLTAIAALYRPLE